jgi:hypothetical protein
MRTLFRIVISFFLVFFVLSCKKDTQNADQNPDSPAPSTSSPTTTPTPTLTGSGNIKIVFNNMVDAQVLQLNKDYQNPAGESYKITKFNYYISNIVLTKNDNSTTSIKNFYQIVKQSDSLSRIITLTDIPGGSYQSIRFMVGVDSARNCSGVQSGGLDPAYASDMYWSWSQGYIFLKLEGASPSSTLNSNGYIEYHLGGYGGPNKTQCNFNLSFNNSTANVSSSTTPTINLTVNVNEMFQTPTQIKFASLPSVVSSNPNAKMLADNYADMITFGSVKN